MNLPDLSSLATGDGFYFNSSGSRKAVDYAVLRDQVRLGGSGSATLGLGVSKLNWFQFNLKNTSGTLQHQFVGLDETTIAPFVTAVNGASATLQNTPTGTDSSTPFVAGAKIGSTQTHVLWLDTADINVAGNNPL